MSQIIDQDGRPVRVLAIGQMYFSDYEEEHDSIRAAIQAGGWACEYNTWAILRIEVGGQMVMERDEILERFDDERYDDLPDVGVYLRELPAGGKASAPDGGPASPADGPCEVAGEEREAEPDKVYIVGRDAERGEDEAERGSDRKHDPAVPGDG